MADKTPSDGATSARSTKKGPEPTSYLTEAVYQAALAAVSRAIREDDEKARQAA
jgi:hypothetical protein